MLGTSEQTVKISKADFTKTGHTAISKSQWIGFSNKKAGCDKSEKWRKKKLYPFLGFFHQNHPLVVNTTLTQLFPMHPFFTP